MILFNLTCSQDHRFEGWFRDGATYDAQAGSGEVVCPVCGTTDVRKAPMAPNVVTTDRSVGQRVTELHQALVAVREHVENNADYVGERFPEEARRIHYGETAERAIYGEASATETEALRDEGVEVVTIPWLPRQDS